MPAKAIKPFVASLDPADWPADTRERAAYLDRLLHKVICVGCDTTPRKAWMGMLTGESNYGFRCNCWPDPPKPVQQIYHVDERRWNMVKNELERRPDQLPEITIRDVKEHLASKATDPEIQLFVRFCVSQDLNPFAREAHLVKIQGQPAYIQVDYKVLFRLAHRDPDYVSYKAGVSVLVDDNLERRTGSLVLPNEVLVGGWCKIKMKADSEPIEEEVGFAEFDTGQAVWKKKPGFMIEKVAITTAFRRAVRGIEDLMGAAAAMRVEAAEVEGPIIEALEAPAAAPEEHDPTTGGLYEAPSSPAEPTSEADTRRSSYEEAYDRAYRLNPTEHESDDRPALLPPEQGSVANGVPHKFTSLKEWITAFKDDFGLDTKAKIEVVLEKAGLPPIAQIGNFAEAYATIAHHFAEQGDSDA